MFLVFRTGGPGLLTISRFNDFVALSTARRLGLTLNDSLKRALLGVARSSLAGDCIAKNPMNTSHPFDLVIGLDRSDRKADLHLIDTRSGKTEKQLLSTSPEALRDWLAKLRQHIAPESPVRFVDAFVSALDLRAPFWQSHSGAHRSSRL